MPHSTLQWIRAAVSPDMPEDVLHQASRRVRHGAAAFAAIWLAIIIIVGTFRLLGDTPPVQSGFWTPWGYGAALIGLAISLVMTWYASDRARPPRRIMSAAMVHLVLSSALLGLLHNWAPPADPVGISPIALILPIYPALAPISAAATLAASLLAAAMDPLTWGIAALRGAAPHRTLLEQTEAFVPTFVAAGLAAYVAAVVRSLGEEIREARGVGSYRVGALIGKGGMGEVYQATHRLLARPAAVKIITPSRSRDSGEEARARERFRREAAVAAALTSPHTIELWDFGTTETGSYYYVMELLKGMDLQAMVDRHGPLPPARAIHFLRQACRSLAEAHRLGLVHRDLKPSNLYVTRLGLESDFLKVLDFGMVKLHPGEAGDARLTREDIPIGTPAYMPPEGVEGGRVLTATSDVYSLGCVAFFLLTGELLFHRGSLMQMAAAHVSDPPRSPSAVHGEAIPPALDALVLRCLAKRPGDRPADAAVLLAEMEPLALAHPWSVAEAERWWAAHPQGAGLA